MPKIFLRTSIDRVSKKAIREVVDGQQRLNAILDFANDKLVLSSRAKEFSGKRYSTLSDEEQEAFLSYAIAADQLVNASDSDVLEVFSRLNSYSVTLNDAETRHVTFQGDFKWAVHESAQAWSALWDDYAIMTTQQRVRMQDDSLMAEMYGLFLEGVKDGGQPRIKALYQKYDNESDIVKATTKSLNLVLAYMSEHILPQLKGTILMRGPHFLMLFAAIAHIRVGLPVGDMKGDMPKAPQKALSDVSTAIDNFRLLASIIDEDKPPVHYQDFWRASKSTTQRIASRRQRFPVLVEATGTKPFE